MQQRLSLKRNTILNSIGSLFFLVCQWLISVLAVRLGSYADGGIYSLALSITNVFLSLSTFAIRYFQVSDTDGQYSPTRYITTRVLTCTAGFVSCVIFTLLNRQYSAVQSWCIVLYMTFRVTEALVDTFAAEQQKAWRMDYICTSFLLRGALSLGSFALIMATTRSLPLALLAMSSLSMLVVIFYDGRIVRRMTGFTISVDWRETLTLLREALPLMLSSAMLTMLTTIPRYMLERSAGSEVLGIYGAIATPAVIVQAGCSFIYSPLVAPLSEAYNGGRIRDFRRTIIRAVGVIAALMAVMLIGAAILGRWGLQLLFGESILAYAWMLIPVLLTSLCSAMVYFFEVPMTIIRRQKLMAGIHAAAIAASVILSAVLIPRMGMTGVNLVMYLCAGGDALAMGAATFLLTGGEKPKTKEAPRMHTALLTIDDVSSKNTPAIVDYLCGKGIRAIMFATGANVERYWDEAIYAVQHGMIVGNHSYSHPHFSELTLEEGVAEIERCEAILDRLYRESGVERKYRPFRFPYGDKGGENSEALQAYLRDHGFHKVEDRHLDYPWWKKGGRDASIDTFWTFDFGEYQIPWGQGYTLEDIWAHMHDPKPQYGAPLMQEGTRHILLLHAHDETEAAVPGYYRLFIDHLLESGITFDEPKFYE